jgi:hypothetical protein
MREKWKRETKGGRRKVGQNGDERERARGKRSKKQDGPEIPSALRCNLYGQL